MRMGEDLHVIRPGMQPGLASAYVLCCLVSHLIAFVYQSNVASWTRQSDYIAFALFSLIFLYSSLVCIYLVFGFVGNLFRRRFPVVLYRLNFHLLFGLLLEHQ